jgi:hypothetical protein
LAILCKTLGSSERIRIPLPAARIIVVIFIFDPVKQEKPDSVL